LGDARGFSTGCGLFRKNEDAAASSFVLSVAPVLQLPAEEGLYQRPFIIPVGHARGKAGGAAGIGNGEAYNWGLAHTTFPLAVVLAVVGSIWMMVKKRAAKKELAANAE
jgi:hypothetical protein